MGWNESKNSACLEQFGNFFSNPHPPSSAPLGQSLNFAEETFFLERARRMRFLPTSDFRRSCSCHGFDREMLLWPNGTSRTRDHS